MTANRPFRLILLAGALAAMFASVSLAADAQTTAIAGQCTGGGPKLPPGFCATIFADHLGHARHLVVTPGGVVYVNTWSGLYYGNDKPPEGGLLVALRYERHRSCRCQQTFRYYRQYG